MFSNAKKFLYYHPCIFTEVITNIKVIVVIIFSFPIFSCTTNSQYFKTIKIYALRDSCYYLNDSVKRKIEIVENTLEDTVILGFAVLPPNYTGKFNYLRLDERVDAAIYPETPEYLLPKTKMFCINLYKGRPKKGYIVVKYHSSK